MAHRTSHTRNSRFGTVGFLRTLALGVLRVTPASGFGTIIRARQHAEYERMTCAALACLLDTESNGECFEQDSLDHFTGRTETFRVNGAPDRLQGGELLGKSTAGCDGADFLAGHYPVTRAAATACLQPCVDHLRNRFRQGVTTVARLATSTGAASQRQRAVSAGRLCRYYRLLRSNQVLLGSYHYASFYHSPISSYWSSPFDSGVLQHDCQLYYGVIAHD